MDNLYCVLLLITVIGLVLAGWSPQEEEYMRSLLGFWNNTFFKCANKYCKDNNLIN